MRRPRGPIRQRSRLYTGHVGPLRVDFWYHPRQFAIKMGDWYIRRGDRWELYQSAPREGDVPKPVTNTNALAGIPPPRKPSQLLKNLKELNQYLSDATWPDGTVMGPVQLSLRTRGGVIVAQLKLGDHGGLRMSVEGSHVDDALAGLEAALSTEPAPWECDPYPLDGAKKKPKK